MAPETRAAKRRRLLEEAPLLPMRPELPDALFVRLAQNLDVATMTNLGGCSRALRHRLYEGSNQDKLWDVVDFGAVCAKVAGGITDKQLKGLLEKINARENTKVLRLTGCKHIRGHGLSPLRGFGLLQELDMRTLVEIDSVSVRSMLSVDTLGRHRRTGGLAIEILRYQGSFETEDSDEYEGSVRNGLPDVWGVMNYADGDRYEGEWNNGKKEGWGRYIWEDGAIYEGEWKNNKREGRGKMRCSSGSFSVYDTK